MNQTTEDMNQKNLEYLQNQVKYTGFADGFGSILKEKLDEGQAKFQLNHQAKYGQDTVNVTLDFSKSKIMDMYFFNSYKAELQKEQEKNSIAQTFSVSKHNTVTLKEAYNLLSGRAVNKDMVNKQGEKYNSWIQLDFKQTDNNGNFKKQRYNENYGYDLAKVLAEHPIKDLTNAEYKDKIMESLKKGNRQSVTFELEKGEVKQYIEANPRFKSINIYDSDMQRIDNRQWKKESQTQSNGIAQETAKHDSGKQESVKQESKKEKQAQDQDDGPDQPKAANTKRKRKSQSI